MGYHMEVRRSRKGVCSELEILEHQLTRIIHVNFVIFRSFSFEKMRRLHVPGHTAG